MGSPHAIAWYATFLCSTVLHEASHAYVGMKGGDDTAYRGGQVSLNPMPHIQRAPLGMVVVPLITLAIIGWPLGFASAPYDPFWAQRHPKRAALMSLAGPMSNLLLATLAFLLMRLGLAMEVFSAPLAGHTFELTRLLHAVDETSVWVYVIPWLSICLMLNLILFVFNMFPFPPLDGSGVLPLFMSDEKGARLQVWMSNPSFMFFGLFIACYSMNFIFKPLRYFALLILYPDKSFTDVF
jgi:Zn-dependent protease